MVVYVVNLVLYIFINFNIKIKREKDMTDKEKIKKIKEIIDNNNLGYWDDTTIMCNKISDIIYENNTGETNEPRMETSK